ncbi:hypothetical protein T492DRAFT_902254 [Pavlovales sp. CCMP2436]|nr:hypothetical protein T492DRAFT_902254 [Pavlovales sp. CCMP2436]
MRVEKILKYRFNNRARRDEWQIKWQGYPASKNSWVPLENLTDDLVAVAQGLKTSATGPRPAIIDDSD